MIDQTFINTSPDTITAATRAVYDGKTFTVTDKDLDAIVFEFDNNGSVTAGREAVDIRFVTTRSALTSTVVNAINNPSATTILALPGRDYFAKASLQGPTGSANDMIVFNDNTSFTAQPIATSIAVGVGGPLKIGGNYGLTLSATDFGLVGATGPTEIRLEEFYTERK